jgi:hypothetical protein
VLPWPTVGKPGKTSINGNPAAWQNGELRITALPAEILVFPAK